MTTAIVLIVVGGLAGVILGLLALRALRRRVTRRRGATVDGHTMTGWWRVP